ncbi:MAG: hypothetical protein SPE74_04480 [Oscillospiraceae bacterium]|nr:hypothetical protein [Oscillospiraceae bacterium]
MASIVALLGAYKPFQKKLDITFVWGERNQSVPQLIIQNLSNRSVVIKKVQFTLQNRLIGVVNVLGDYGFGRYAVVLCHTSVCIDIPVYPNDNTKWSERQSGLYVSALLGKMDERKKPMKIVAEDITGKKHTARLKFSEAELSDLFLGYSVLND